MTATVTHRLQQGVLHGATQVVKTSLGRRLLATNALVAFGAVSAAIQLVAAIYRSFPSHPEVTFAMSPGILPGVGHDPRLPEILPRA